MKTRCWRMLRIAALTVLAVVAVPIGCLLVVGMYGIPFSEISPDVPDGKVISSDPPRTPEELDRILGRVDDRVNTFTKNHPGKGKRGFVHEA